ncbi:MAG: SRPBCC family protein [Candidatus Scalindua sp.]
MIFVLISCARTQTNITNRNLSSIDSFVIGDSKDVLIICDVVLTVERPVEEVFAYLIDPDTVPDWQPDIAKQTKITEDPMRVGTRLLNSRKTVFNKNFEYEREVVKYIPFKTYSFNNLDPSLRFNITYGLEPVKNGTKIKILGTFLEPKTGRYRFLPRWILKYAIKTVFVKHNKLLKRNIESKYSINVNKWYE